MLPVGLELGSTKESLKSWLRWTLIQITASSHGADRLECARGVLGGSLCPRLRRILKQKRRGLIVITSAMQMKLGLYVSCIGFVNVELCACIVPGREKILGKWLTGNNRDQTWQLPVVTMCRKSSLCIKLVRRAMVMNATRWQSIATCRWV